MSASLQAWISGPVLQDARRFRGPPRPSPVTLFSILMRTPASLVAGFIVTVLLASCGLPGAPQPPSLRLPRPVSDLAAWRKGDHVYLSWTPPQRTTDAAILRHPGPTSICRAINRPRMEDCLKIAQLPPPPNAPEAAEYSDALAAELQRQHPLGFATYAVQAFNDRGRAAGLSNQVEVPLAPTLPPPSDLRAEVDRRGRSAHLVRHAG